MNKKLQIHLFFIFIGCSIVFYTDTVFAQDTIQKNTELLQRVIEKSVERLAGEIPVGFPVVLTIQGSEYDWFFRHRTVEILTEKGYSVSQSRNDAGVHFYVVEMAIGSFGMRYSDIRRRSFLGSRVMTRHASGDFSFRIIGENRERVVRISESVSDDIPYGKRNEIENEALPFTRAELPEGSLTERFIGPAVIVAATGLVVYLFFSVRS